MKLLTVRQAAKESGIGYTTMRRLIKEGRVPVVKVPGRQFALVRPESLSTAIQAWESGSLSGSIENPEVAEVQSSPAQKEKSRRRGPGGAAAKDVPYYERFKGRDACK